MSVKLVFSPNDIKQDLSDFVHQHPNGNIFQTPEMFDVYSKTKNLEPLYLGLLNHSGEIIASLLAVLQKEYTGLIGNLTCRSIIIGGPLIKNGDPDLMGLILREYKKILKKRALYTQIRNLWDTAVYKQEFFRENYSFEDHLNIRINLDKSLDSLWSDIHSKRRNEIRRAIKEGTIFSVENDLESLKKCYDILIKVYARVKLPLPDYSFFYNLFIIPDKNTGIKLFCAKYDGKIIGCIICLYFNRTLYDFYAGAIPEFYKKYPNDLIPWEVFKWGKENGYKFFDFGGAGKPDKYYGVREYKKKFGGEILNYGRFQLIHKKFYYLIAKKAFKFWQLFIK